MTAVTPGRDNLIASVASSLEGRSFAYTQGEHHRKFAQKIIDEVIARLAAKPDDPDAMNERRAAEDAEIASNVREATIVECAKVCDRWISSRNLHESLAATDIKRDIFRLSTTGKPKP